jgi:hypothetical protein
MGEDKMQIPNDPVVWGILIVLAAAVLGFAIWRRYSVVVRKGDTELRLERPEEGSAGGISVAGGAKISNSTVGNITGAQISGGTAPSVEVAKGARITGSKVGDITGVAQQSGPPKT